MMLRTLAKSLSGTRLSPLSFLSTINRIPTGSCPAGACRSFSMVDDEMPFLHHGKRPRFRGHKKFKSQRKRASILLQEVTAEAMNETKEARPKVWNTPFRVGDAIEIKFIAQGGVNSHEYEKYRGVVLGVFRKGLDTSVLIRDVVFGQPVERRIPLYSPLLKSLKVLEENFVFKGKRKVKRAKLYYLRDRNPLGECCVGRNFSRSLHLVC